MAANVETGDSLDWLKTLPECSVDALVTDPPAGIAFMGKTWDGDKGGRDQWIAWLAAILREAHRVLKPGAHGLVWALPRTSHWTGMACEDAGFECRDIVTHLFGSGFPKSLNVSKAIDALHGVEPIDLGQSPNWREAKRNNHIMQPMRGENCGRITAPATPDAQRWHGWGTALKPAVEFYFLIRKPVKGTVAANVLRYGTGALNVDGCRIRDGNETNEPRPTYTPNNENNVYGRGMGGGEWVNANGRWPAHLVLSGDAPAMLDAQSGHTVSRSDPNDGLGVRAGGFGDVGASKGSPFPNAAGFNDSGGASRFFYCAKAATNEREAGLDDLPLRTAAELVGRTEGSAGTNSPRAGAGRVANARRNTHPTVKPIDLMRWLCRLITPPGGLVLDPFAGSGTTGVACALEGFGFLGCELDPAHVAIAERRIAAAMAHRFVVVDGSAQVSTTPAEQLDLFR